MSKNPVAIHKHHAEPTVPRSAAERLIESVIEIGNGPPNLAERRRALLTVLTEVLDADGGLWSWGRGTPDAETVIPVAVIDVGLSKAQRATIVEGVLGPEADRLFVERVQARKGDQVGVTSRRQDIFSNEEWQSRPMMQQSLERVGLDCWLHSVRYSAADTWSTFVFSRQLGRKPFSPWQAEVTDLAMTSVAWMHSAGELVQPPETLVSLKPRQRMVMLMLLDGLTRKTIAGQLGITEGTVGDHIKAIYSHFRVGSATELAALFLRGK